MTSREQPKYELNLVRIVGEMKMGYCFIPERHGGNNACGEWPKGSSDLFHFFISKIQRNFCLFHSRRLSFILEENARLFSYY